jgi:tRNA dimethylallyltransferase
MNKVVIISGPTASGKTQLSIELAKKYNGVIVNFDSLLFYKELLIGTARPTEEEMDGVPHYLVGTQSAHSPLNANQYMKLALPLIQDLLKQNKLVFLVGGSGFYLQALLHGMYEDKSSSEDVLRRSEELYQKEGISAFREILKEHDPINYERLHENDHYRIRRAVEYFWTTNRPFSEAKIKHEEEKNHESNNDNIHGWSTLHLYLNIPKEQHYPIILKRTEKMFQQGLVTEVQNLLQAGFTGLEKPLQSIGYKEVLLYLEGKISLEQCKEDIFISTRQLAKSQRTWFNRISNKIEINPLEGASSLFVQNCVKDFL